MIGFLSDRVGRINVAALSTLTAALAAFFLWIFAGKYYAGAIIYSLFGAFAGAIWPCIAPVAVEVVGLQLLPSCKWLATHFCLELLTNTHLAMSITWLVLVLPATFAEVVGLSLVTPGSNGYLHVQIYTGCMFIVAFVCRKSRPSPTPNCPPPFLSSMRERRHALISLSVWTLRVYKLYLMEAAGLTPEERERDIRNPDAVSLSTHRREKRISVAFVTKACFAVTKV